MLHTDLVIPNTAYEIRLLLNILHSTIVRMFSYTRNNIHL